MAKLRNLNTLSQVFSFVETAVAQYLNLSWNRVRSLLYIHVFSRYDSYIILKIGIGISGAAIIGELESR